MDGWKKKWMAEKKNGWLKQHSFFLVLSDRREKKMDKKEWMAVLPLPKKFHLNQYHTQ